QGGGGRVADSRTESPPMPMPSAFHPSISSERSWTPRGGPPCFSIILMDGPLVQREREILLVQLLEGAVAHHLGEGLVQRLAELAVFAGQAGRDANAQVLVVLDVLAHDLAALALRLLAPQPELRLVAEHRVDLVVGERLQSVGDAGIALDLGRAAETLVDPVGVRGVLLHADALVAQQGGRAVV